MMSLGALLFFLPQGLRKVLFLEGCSNPEKESYLPKIVCKERGQKDWLSKYFKCCVDIMRWLTDYRKYEGQNVQI